MLILFQIAGFSKENVIEICKYKVKLVVRSYAQKNGKKTFSSVVKYDTFRWVAIVMDLKLIFDMKTAFLYGDLHGERNYLYKATNRLRARWSYVCYEKACMN